MATSATAGAQLAGNRTDWSRVSDLDQAANFPLAARRDSTDPLTGIRNRRGFLDAAAPLVDRCHRSAQSIALVQLQIVGFEDVVRDQGLSRSEALLRATAGLLGLLSRRGDLAARTGLAEFSILLPGASLEQAHDIADRMVEGARVLSDSARSGAMAVRPLQFTWSARLVEASIADL